MTITRRFFLGIVLFLAMAGICSAAGPYYWVGGEGNTSDATNHWSTSSGGSPNAANVSTSTDDVIWDANSNATAYTVTVDATFTFRDMTWALPGTSGVPTLQSSLPSMDIYGSVSFAPGMILGTGLDINFRGTSGIKTITTNGVINTDGVWTFYASGATFQLADDLTSSANRLFVLQSGALFDANGHDVNFTGGGAQISGAFTFYNLSRTGTAITVGFLRLYSNITVANQFTITGNSVVNRLLVTADTIGTPRTITCNGIVTAINTDFHDISGAGTASWDFSAQTDIGGGTALTGCSGITFPAAQTCYWVAATTGSKNWSDLTGSVGTYWMTTSGGSTKTRLPLMQDTERFDANSFAATGSAVLQDMPRIGSVDWTGATNTPTWTTSTTASVYGGITLVTGMTLMASTQAYTFEGRGSYPLTSAGKTWAKAITLNAPGGTLTQQDAFTSTAAVTSTNGTWAAGSNSLTAAAYTAAAGATTTGTGTWILTSTGTVFTGAGIITFTGNHVIKLTDTSATTKTFAGGGITYNHLWLAPGAGTGTFQFTGGNTFNDFKDDGTEAHSILFTAGTTTTVASWNVNGSAGKLKTIGSITAAAHTLTKSPAGRVTCAYCSISYSQAGPANNWYAPLSTDGLNNTGWIFGAPPGGRLLLGAGR